MTVSLLQTLSGHTSDVTCCEFYGKNVLYTGSSDKTLRVWRWQDGAGFKEEDISPVCGHKYGVTSIRVSPKGDLLASSSVDGTTILWDLANLNRLHVLVQDSGEAVRACAFSFDAIILVTAGDSGAICVWKIPECILACIIRHHEDAVHSLCFTPDSQILLTACTMGNVRLTLNSWRNCLDVGDQETESLYNLDAAHDLGVLSADFSRKVVSGKHSRVTIYMAVTCGTDRFIKLWRVVSTYLKSEETLYGGNLLPKVTVQLLFAIQGHGSSVTCVKFSFGGDMLASSSLDKTIKFWNVQLHCRATLAEHTRYVNCIGFNSDSALLCSGSNDRSVLIWDMSGNLTLASNLARPHSFLASAFNTDIPDYFLCPITHELLVDPVTCEDDFTYERQAIAAWFQSGHSCSPMTNEELSSTELISNITIKEEIRQFSIANSLL